MSTFKVETVTVRDDGKRFSSFLCRCNTITRAVEATTTLTNDIDVLWANPHPSNLLPTIAARRVSGTWSVLDPFKGWTPLETAVAA